MKKKSVVPGLLYPCAKKMMLIMRLTIFLVIISVMASTASVYSQTTKLTVKMNNSRIADVFDAIEKQSEFYFFYNRDSFDDNKIVSVDFEGKTVDQILDEIFDGQSVTYEIINKDILIKTVDETSGTSGIQQKSVSGKVTDTSGQPLPGVTVIVKGTTNGSVTNMDGAYTLSNIPAGAILQYSFVGMRGQEVEVGDQSIINIVLEEETIGLEEVVAIGYGVTKRKNFTGSVTSVDMESSPVMNKATTDAFSLLDGITTGINFTKSGEAGENSSMLVRGQRSISEGSTSPLLVVDGVIYSGNMNDIDPTTVESVQVLKDATSLAAYGSQAANGVIMITRKKGKIGKPMINLRTSTALSSPNFRPEMRTPEGYIQLMNDRSGSEMGWISDLEKTNYDANTPTDWYDLINRTGVQQNYALNVSGARESMDYFLSASYLDNKNFIEANDYTRTTFSARINTRVNEYLSVGANFDQSYNQNDGVRPAYGRAITLSPWTEPYLSDGRWRKYVDGREETTQNPLWNTYNGIDHENRRISTVIGGNAEFKIPGVEGLSYKITGSYTTNNTTTRRFVYETNFVNLSLGEAGYTPTEQDKYLDQANGYIDENKVKSWVIDNILTYTKEIDEHFVNATLVYTRDSRQVDAYRMTGSDFSDVGNTNLGFYGLTNATVQQIASITYNLHNDVGYLARASYSYKDTYHLNASIRRDGSSVFGADKKWGNFPAVGVAWTASNESFLSSVPSINNLKLKASWGKNGNQSLSPYGTLSTMNVGKDGGVGYFFDGDVYYGQSLATLGNTELGWETTTSFNLGAEADLFKRRVHFEIDGYKSKTTEQIFSRTIPVMGSGISEQNATMGRVDNWGIEAVLGTTNIESGDFRWTSRLTFSMNRNKLVELYGDGEDDINAGLFLGESLGAIYGYKWIGIVQADDVDYMEANGAHAGDAKYANLDGSEDGRITVSDRAILGFNKDNFRMSLQNTFSYKNFQLYLLFNGTFGGNDFGVAENNSAYLTSDSYAYHNTLNHPYWTEDDPSDTYPAIDYADDRFTALQSYGFVRLQEANLSYSFNRELLQRFDISALSVFVSGSNLFFIAPDWEFSDPEIRRYDAAQLPRSFTLGINLTF